jgi:hypothetical protein
VAVIVSNGATTLGTASGFYRAESYNLGMFSATTLTLATPRAINVTFANAGNSLGVILCLIPVTASTNIKSVDCALQETKGTCTMTIASPGVVTNAGHGLVAGDAIAFSTTGALPTGVTANLRYFVIATGLTANTFQFSLTAGGAAVNTSGSQSGVHTLWVDRRSAIVTNTSIYNNTSANTATGYTATFSWAGYAVTTAASTWRFKVERSGAQTNEWALKTSDATNPFYVAYCDNAVTFANNDCVIAKDTVTVDTNATVKGVLGTGDTTLAVAWLNCTMTPAPTTSNSSHGLGWDGSASRTLTVDGCIFTMAHGAIRIGTSVSPISYANQAIIDFINPTLGTTCGIRDGNGVTSSNLALRHSLFLYGEAPTVRYGTLNANGAVGAGSVTTAEDLSSWQSGWRIAIGKQNVIGTGSTTIFTLSGVPSWSGVQSTLSFAPTIPTNQRQSGARVFAIDGYGIRIKSTTTNRWSIFHRGPSNYICQGVLFEELGSSSQTLNFSSSFSGDDAANRSEYLWDKCVFYNTLANTSGVVSTPVPINGARMQDCHSWNCVLTATPAYTAGTSGVWQMVNNYQGSTSTVQSNPGTTNAVITGNIFDNAGWLHVIAGANITFNNNEFWGGSNSQGTCFLQNLVKPASFDNNKWNRCTIGLSVNSTVVGLDGTDNIFGTTSANTTDLFFAVDSVSIDNILRSTSGNLTISGQSSTIGIPSTFRLESANDVVTDDREYQTYGTYQRTGYNLSDTTAWTGTAFGVASAGQYALRLQPNSSTNALVWSFSKTTGDCQNLTMTVTARVKINNAAYYAGVYTLPTLEIEYDGGTIASHVASASTSDQQLQVIFTPLTTSEAITIRIKGATDASGSNAYFYIGQVTPNLPPGVSIDSTSLSLWADARPLPPDSTFPTPSNLWDEPISTHTISGSFGAFIQKLLTVGKFLGLK